MAVEKEQCPTCSGKMEIGWLPMTPRGSPLPVGWTKGRTVASLMGKPIGVHAWRCTNCELLRSDVDDTIIASGAFRP